MGSKVLTDEILEYLFNIYETPHRRSLGCCVGFALLGKLSFRCRGLSQACWVFGAGSHQIQSLGYLEGLF